MKFKVRPAFYLNFNLVNLALIGTGGFSKVVRVQHRATGQRYAIKMVETLNKDGQETCERELQVLR